jgi:hypothetical protein
MSYSDFLLTDIKEKLGLSLVERQSLFADAEPAACSEHLRETLRFNLPLATAINTEKARSEFIVAPVLVEIVKQCKSDISLFSGIEFAVDKGLGLNGVCDYILSLSPEQLILDAPLMVIVEAKNDNLKSGLGQCISEMWAASVFNRKQGRELAAIHGAVTTGSLWSFLRLAGDKVWIDADEYHISSLAKIVGIFLQIVNSSRAAL